MSFEQGTQTDMFLEDDPELQENFERANFRVSVLGGSRSEDPARSLGIALAEHRFSISTGGYNTGAMKGTLEGAAQVERILRESKTDKSVEVLPTYIGVVAGDTRPEKAVTGEHIQTHIAENLYDRLRILSTESNVCIVLPGDQGTALEADALLHFENYAIQRFNLDKKGLPIIFIGHTFDTHIQSFPKLLSNNNTIFRVDSIEEATSIVEALFQLKQSGSSEKSLSNFNETVGKYLFQLKQ